MKLNDLTSMFSLHFVTIVKKKSVMICVCRGAGVCGCVWGGGGGVGVGDLLPIST